MFQILCIIVFSCLLSANVIAEPSQTIPYLYEIENDEVTITAGGSLNDVIIPDYIEGHPVTKIASRALFLNSYYTSITLPETLVTIEKEAILSCENIKETIIPRNVKNIGKRALGYEMEHIPVYGSSEIYTAFYKIDDFIIRGYKGTTAETYAKDNGFTFIALDDEPITTTPATTDITTTETTVVTTQTTPITTIPDITENIIGDVNGDGKLTASDAAFIAKTLAEASISNEKIEAKDYPIMDFNQDGKVTAKDAADIARYLAEQLITQEQILM